MERPDLSGVHPSVLAYIEYLEQKISTRQKKEREKSVETADEFDHEITFFEAPTKINVVTFSTSGMVKKTPRHFYGRQHRGGMGVFDIDSPEKNQPEFLCCAEDDQTLLLFSNFGRVYRYPMSKLDESPVRGKGQNLERLPLVEGEIIIAALPEQASGYVALASRTGFVRCLRHHIFGEHIRPGTSMFNHAEHGALAAVCWTDGSSDILLVTKKGIGIRFSEKAVPPQGTRGIFLSPDDELVAVSPSHQDDGIAVFTAEGKGSIRLMSGFSANKSPGGSGKIVIRSEHVIGATRVNSGEDVFLISRLGKIIRFLSNEIPSSEGVVQGVNCMSLRSDEVVSAVISSGVNTVK